MVSPEPIDIEMGLSGRQRCSQCRSETVIVSVDAGAGCDLPLFVKSEPNSRGERAVQLVHEPLRGELCPNCGLLRAHLRLSRQEILSYQQQTRDLAPSQASDPWRSSLAATRVKRPA